MRFLRESAVEKVLHGHDDAAGNQQGDVRRMSALDLLARQPAARRGDRARRPTRCRRPSLGSRGRDAIVRGLRLRAAAGRAPSVPSLTGQNIVDRAAVVAALQSRGRRGSGRGPAGWRWWCPTSRRASRWCGSTRCRAARDDLDQLIRWQIKKSAPFPIEDAMRHLHARAAASDGGREFVVALARRDTVREYEERLRGGRAARRARRPVDVQRRQLLPGGRPRPDRRLAGGPHAAGLHVDRHHARRRRRSSSATRPKATATRSPTWCTRRRCTTRTGCPGRASRACSSAAPAAPAPTSRVARRGLEERLGTPVEPIDPTRLALLPDRLTERAGRAWPCGAARRHAAAHAPGSGGRLMLRTNLSTRPFYNVRAVRAIIARPVAALVALATPFNVVRAGRA